MQFVLAIVNFLGNACIVKLELLQYSKNDKNNVFCYIYYIVSSLTFVFDKYMKSINFCYSGYHIDAFGKKSRIVKLFLSSQQCIILQQYRIYRQVFIGKYLQASIYRQVFIGKYLQASIWLLVRLLRSRLSLYVTYFRKDILDREI